MIKKILLPILLILTVLPGRSQDVEYTTISYTEFFDLIKQEQDSVVNLSNTIVVYNPETDRRHYYSEDPAKQGDIITDYLEVDKQLFFNNVHFDTKGGRNGYNLHHIHFKKEVILLGVGSVFFDHCEFDDYVTIFVQDNSKDGLDWLNNQEYWGQRPISTHNCSFMKGYDLVMQAADEDLEIYVSIVSCDIYPQDDRKSFVFTSLRGNQITINNNNFYGFESIYFVSTSYDYFNLIGNTADTGDMFLQLRQQNLTSSAFVANNSWPEYVFFQADVLNSSTHLEWDQWDNKLHNYSSLRDYENIDRYSKTSQEKIDSLMNQYVNQAIYENQYYFDQELKVLGQLIDLYDSQHNSHSSNAAFINIKNLETKRYEYLYEQDKNFDTFFQWKVNSFLKVFSDYGTRPSKAIVFSLYVILIFALFYLFTPNSWDTLNQNRLIRRIKFFTKYFRQKEGLKEVYEEEKVSSIMSYNQFKDYMTESRYEIPRYFLIVAKPLYYFSLSNYKTTTAILSKMDILKGKWAELPNARRAWTSFIMAIWLLLMILFDLSVKVLNAIILSINTFTTLGFGEIPIRGVARYLAIIQGFIGWFMLSLFSVSLISQLMH